MLDDRARHSDGAVADVQLGRRREAECLEELLRAADARGAGPLHRVGPAVGGVPLGDLALLEQDGRPLGVGLGLLGNLERTARPGQRPAAGVWLHWHVAADDNRDWLAAVGVNQQLSL